MISIRRVAGLILASALVLAGCKQKTTSDQVLDQYRKGEKAIANFDLEAYKATMSPDSLAQLESELTLARTASEQDLTGC